MNRDQLEQSLRNDELLKSIPPNQRELIIDIAHIRHVKAGSVLYRKGDSMDGLIRLLSGHVRIGASTVSGNDFILTTLGPGDWFGEISIFDGLPRSHDATTIEACDFASFSASKLKLLCKQYVEINDMMIMLLCAHMRAAFIAIDDFLLLTPEQRLIKRIVEIVGKQHGQTTVKLSQQDLSDLLGVSRQSISKFLKSWEQKGLIRRVYGGLDVINVSSLMGMLPNQI